MRYRAALLLIVLACLLAACDPLGPVATPTPPPAPPTPTLAEATDTPEPPEPTDTPEEEVTSTPPAEAVVTAQPSLTATVSLEEIEREIKEIEEATTELRNLEPKKDMPEFFATQEQMTRNLAAEIDKEYSPEESRQDATGLWLLRLLEDPSIDLLKLQKDLLGEQVLGYYDPEKDELYVRKDQAELSGESRMTAAHEFTHGLQDQYFDLEKLQPDDIDNDRGSAVLALIEGDATITGILYAQLSMSQEEFQKMIEDSGNSSTDVLDRAPRYIRESLIFPYQEGPNFVLQLVQPGAQPGDVDYSAVDKALQDPPVSTEQILHPEKYLETPRDEPVTVTLPPLTGTLGAGWTMPDTDTIGEFDLRIMLQENGVDEERANEAAAGWGGAQYALYQKGDAGLAILDTRWDTPTDADEFDDAMQESLSEEQKAGDLWTDGKRFFGLKRTGDKIAYVAGTERDAVEKALGEIEH